MPVNVTVVGHVSVGIGLGCQKALAVDPGDGPAPVHLRLCLNYVVSGPDAPGPPDGLPVKVKDLYISFLFKRITSSSDFLYKRDLLSQRIGSIGQCAYGEQSH